GTDTGYPRDGIESLRVDVQYSPNTINNKVLVPSPAEYLRTIARPSRNRLKRCQHCQHMRYSFTTRSLGEEANMTLGISARRDVLKQLAALGAIGLPAAAAISRRA